MIVSVKLFVFALSSSGAAEVVQPVLASSRKFEAVKQQRSGCVNSVVSRLIGRRLCGFIRVLLAFCLIFSLLLFFLLLFLGNIFLAFLECVVGFGHLLSYLVGLDVWMKHKGASPYTINFLTSPNGQNATAEAGWCSTLVSWTCFVGWWCGIGMSPAASCIGGYRPRLFERQSAKIILHAFQLA